MPDRRPASAPLTWLSLAALLTTVALCMGCGNGNGEETSAADLKVLLPPPAQLQLKPQRTFAWDNATDFVVQGTVLPQSTAPSSAIAKLEDAGFQAAAGEQLAPRGGGSPIYIDAARFDSSDAATDAQAYLHGQDLQQPCYAACTVNPRELDISGIPGATAVQQAPIEGKLPPGAGPPFEAFAVEFTIGSDLFYAYAKGDPGDIPPARFEQGAALFYKYASQHEQ